MNSLHDAAQTWMTSGAVSPPGRDLAVHASVCEECLRAASALDALASIELAAAGDPPKVIGSRRPAIESGPWTPYVATAVGFVLVVATALVIQAWPLIPEPGAGGPGPIQIMEGILGGVLQPSDADGDADPTLASSARASAEPGPDGSEVGVAGRESSAPPPLGPIDVPTPTTSGSVVLPTLPSPGTSTRPVSSTAPSPPGSPISSIPPSPIVTVEPTVAPTRPPSATPQPTPEPPPPTPEPPPPTPEPPPPTPEPPPPPPTPEPTSEPLAECSDGVDNDGDGWIDTGILGLLGDPQCTGPSDNSEAV